MFSNMYSCFTDENGNADIYKDNNLYGFAVRDNDTHSSHIYKMSGEYVGEQVGNYIYDSGMNFMNTIDKDWSGLGTTYDISGID